MLTTITSYFSNIPDVPFIHTWCNYNIAIHTNTFSVDVDKAFKPDINAPRLHVIEDTLTSTPGPCIVGVPMVSKIEYTNSLASKLSWYDLVLFLNQYYNAEVPFIDPKLVSDKLHQLSQHKFAKLVFLPASEFLRFILYLSEVSTKPGFTTNLKRYLSSD